MIVLKEIKVKDYMKGTKALRLRNYIYVGMVLFTAAVAIPSVYFLIEKRKPQYLEKKRLQEEAERDKLQQLFELQASLVEEQEKKRSALRKGSQ